MSNGPNMQIAEKDELSFDGARTGKPVTHLVPPKIQPFTIAEAAAAAEPLLEMIEGTKRERIRQAGESDKRATEHDDRQRKRLLVAASFIVLPLLAMAAFLFWAGRDGAAQTLVQYVVVFAGGFGIGYGTSGRARPMAET
ncbi:MAG: hypothetical protein ACYC2H_12790 [Thermoplasmatota archaeon]